MKNRNQIILAIVIGIMIGTTLTVAAGTYVQAYRNEEISIVVDGEKKVFRDALTNEIEYPLTYNNRTYLPLRSVANMLGFEIDYDDETKTVEIETNNNVKIEEIERPGFAGNLTSPIELPVDRFPKDPNKPDIELPVEPKPIITPEIM